MKKNINTILFRCIVGCAISSAFAEAPVVDYSSVVNPDKEQSAFTAPVKTNLSTEQRIGKLEQQMSNINGQNLSNKIDELQQKLQEANGKLESQAHQIEQLDKQLKDYYQDLNKRLGTTPQATVANTPINAATDASVTSATVTPPSDSAFLKEQQMYQTAIDLLPDKKHESENKLRDYLKQYPKGAYVANTHYWLGEINFLQKNFDAAEEEFRVVVNKYAKSKRVADAALKLALVHQNQGREAEAKQELQKIIKRYPGTSAAQLAKQQLATTN
jgi:tol-pal system protein YbgF